MIDFSKSMFTKKYRKIFLLVLILFFAPGRAFSTENYPALTLNENDRILILAPHPDDEVVGTGGVIQEAIRLKRPLKVVYLTNGDNNELAFIVYDKRLVLSPKEFIRLGEVRKKEAVAAMNFLGVPKDNLIFLGYPDFGTMNILTGYWDPAKPFKSLLTRVAKVPYQDCLSPGAPYVGQSILNDLESILADFKPTKIFVTNFVDTNGDHRSMGLFLQVALWDLEGKIPSVKICPYLVHAAGWPAPRGFHPDLKLLPPGNLANTDVQWEFLNLFPEQIQRKKKAIGFYKSQIIYNPPYLYTFARQNEIFGVYPPIFLQDQPGEPIDWIDLEKRQENKSHLVDEKSPTLKIIQSLAYAQKEGFLDIKMNFRLLADKWLGLNIYLLGYRKDVPFADMPKFRIHIFGNKIRAIYANRKRVVIENVSIKKTPEGVILQFPLSVLKDPEYILSCTKTHINKVTIDLTAWRILIVSHGDVFKPNLDDGPVKGTL